MKSNKIRCYDTLAVCLWERTFAKRRM